MTDYLAQPFLDGRVKVTASPVLICIVGHSSSVVVANIGENTVYLGGDDVSEECGIPLHAGEKLTIWGLPNKSRSLYASSHWTSTVTFLSAG